MVHFLGQQIDTMLSEVNHGSPMEANILFPMFKIMAANCTKRPLGTSEALRKTTTQSPSETLLEIVVLQKDFQMSDKMQPDRC